MSFFGPPPATPPWIPDEPPKWGPPLWDRPAEDTLGISVAMTIRLATSDDDALVLDDVRAYPNGFTFDMVTMRNPNLRAEMDHPGARFGGLGRMVRVGFEFADGSSVSSEQPAFPPTPGSGFAGQSTAVVSFSGPGASSPGNGFDADGVPTGHVLRPQGGGGSQYRQAMGFWCFGLPAPGPMTVHADWPDHFDEVGVEVDATPIVEAASRSVILWDRP